jgi:cell division protein FtsB
LSNSHRKEFNFLQSKGFLLLMVFFLFVLVLTFFFGDRGAVEIVRARKTISGLKDSIARLEAEKATLQDDVRRLRDNPLALERKAREKLWLMKKDEKVIVLVPAR